MDATFFPPAASLKWRVATPLADPHIGRKARKHLQRAEGYTRDRMFESSRKYFNYRLFFPQRLWKKLWKSL